MKGINDFLTLKLYGADLDDFIGIGVQSGGLEVEGDIGLVHSGIIPLWRRALIDAWGNGGFGDGL
jgi:hypothetical protein